MGDAALEIRRFRGYTINESSAQAEGAYGAHAT